MNKDQCDHKAVQRMGPLSGLVVDGCQGAERNPLRGPAGSEITGDSLLVPENDLQVLGMAKHVDDVGEEYQIAG